jgi:predicted ATPase
MAFPEAWIYEISSNGVNRVAYEDTEHFQITKTFLSRHQQMLAQLLGSEGA